MAVPQSRPFGRLAADSIAQDQALRLLTTTVLMSFVVLTYVLAVGGVKLSRRTIHNGRYPANEPAWMVRGLALRVAVLPIAWG